MQRLMRAAMQTGSTTSIIALCVLISFLINNASNSTCVLVITQTFSLNHCWSSRNRLLIRSWACLHIDAFIQLEHPQNGEEGTRQGEQRWQSSWGWSHNVFRWNSYVIVLRVADLLTIGNVDVQRTAVVHMDSVDDLALTPSTYSHSVRRFLFVDHDEKYSRISFYFSKENSVITKTKQRRLFNIENTFITVIVSNCSGTCM